MSGLSVMGSFCRMPQVARRPRNSGSFVVSIPDPRWVRSAHFFVIHSGFDASLREYDGFFAILRVVERLRRATGKR